MKYLAISQHSVAGNLYPAASCVGQLTAADPSCSCPLSSGDRPAGPGLVSGMCRSQDPASPASDPPHLATVRQHD